MPHTRHRVRQRVCHPPPDGAPPAILLIRLMAGGVFAGEGLLKWLFPATLGVGRFLMVVAIAATTIPRGLGTSPLPPLVLSPVGFPAMLYDLRSDVAQLWCAFLLFLGGAGPWAMDALPARTREGGNARAAQERVVR
jgi:putative oxidoreductase